jgi:hypothetical protein
MQIITGFDALAVVAAPVALVIRLISRTLWRSFSLALLVLIAIFGGPLLLSHVKTESRSS